MSKCSKERILQEYSSGKGVQDIAKAYRLHPTTVRRYLRGAGHSLSRVSSPSEVMETDKSKLKQLLALHKTPNVDKLLQDILETFYIESIQVFKFPVIHLQEGINNIVNYEGGFYV